AIGFNVLAQGIRARSEKCRRELRSRQSPPSLRGCRSRDYCLESFNRIEPSECERSLSVVARTRKIRPQGRSPSGAGTVRRTQKGAAAVRRAGERALPVILPARMIRRTFRQFALFSLLIALSSAALGQTPTRPEL